MHVPQGYDGRFPQRSASASAFRQHPHTHSFHDMHHHHTLLEGGNYASSRSLIAPGYHQNGMTWKGESKVKEEFERNANHTPGGGNFKVLSAPRSKLPMSARRSVPAHERFCMSCRSPPCSLVPENQELARQLADVNNAHRNCPTDLANLRSDVASLQEAHKDCASNFQALTSKHNALVKAHAPCAKTIEDLEAIAHEHASCGNRILGTVDDLNDKKSELKDTQGSLHKTQSDLGELTTQYDELSSEHDTCKKDLATLSALKDSMDLCVKNCVEFKPSVGLQFVELPGDGIAVKYAPEALPAYQSGVRNNDMILESNGRLVFSKQDFKRTLEDCVGGDVVPLLIRRGRGNTVVNLTVGAEGYSLEEVRRNRLCADWHDPSWRAGATKFGYIEQRIGEGCPTPGRMGSRTFQKDP